MVRFLPELALVLASCQGVQPGPPAEEVVVHAEAPKERPVSSAWPGLSGISDPFGLEACPLWIEVDRRDPYPTACDPHSSPHNTPHTLYRYDAYVYSGISQQVSDHGLYDGEPLVPVTQSPEVVERLERRRALVRSYQDPKVKISRRYPVGGCSAAPRLGGLDLVVPGLDGQAYIICGELFTPVSGAALAMISNAPTASQERLDELLRFEVHPGTERLVASLPRPELVMPGGPDETTSFFHYALLADGADVHIRGSGGAGNARLVEGLGSEFVNVRGNCGKVDVDLDPWASVGLEGTPSQFDITVGWGVGYVDLHPGTRLEGTSRLHVGGAGRLDLQTDVEVRVDFPEGWTVVCHQVDNPACGTWGPGSLYTAPGAEAVIDLAGPRGVVSLLANPWPEGLACPETDGSTHHYGTVPRGLLHLVEGKVRPECYDERRILLKTMANSDVDPPPEADVTSWLKTPKECASWLPQDQWDPVARGPWPGPPRWGGSNPPD